MVPPDTLSYTDPTSYYAGCKPSALEGRKKTIGKYGTGVPAVTHEEARDNTAGVASTCLRPKRKYMTEQGPIALPFGPGADVSFMPSVTTLNRAPYTDSRLTGISDRYYR
jgi:hypothetical protein